jgi:hypothetical protein
MKVPLRLSENRTIVSSGIPTGVCVRAYFALASRLLPEIAGRDFVRGETAGLPEELPVPPRPAPLD